MSNPKKPTDRSLEGLSMRERNERLAEEKEQRRWRRYGIIAAIVAVLIAALLFWDHGFIQRSATAVTIGSRNYSAADVDYYYFTQYNSMYSYASYYGIDTSKSLRDQEAYDGQSWYEYLRSNAESSLREVSTLAQEGEAEGYTLSEKGQKDLDSALQAAKDAAKENNVSLSYYLRRMFGRFMTWKRFEKIVTEYTYAYDYKEHKTDSFEVSDKEADSYYDEHKAELDTFTFQAYKVNVETSTDESGAEVEATQEQIDAARAKAEKLAKALKSGDEKEISALVTELNAVNYSDTKTASLSSYPFGSWVTDESRKAGDTDVIEDSHTEEVEDADVADSADSSAAPEAEAADASAAAETDTADASAAADSSAKAESAPKRTVTHVDGYYAVRFDARTLDEYKAANVVSVNIPAKEIPAETSADSSAEAAESSAAEAAPTYDMEGAKAAADAFVEQWQSKGGTVDALREMTVAEEDAEESEESEDAADSSAAANSKPETYVLSETSSVEKDGYSFNADVLSWLYGSKHKSGDYYVMEDSSANAYQVICFTEYDELPYWKVTAQNAVRSEKYTEWYDGLSEKYEPKETWFYSQVG